jgi:hypothetical protein
MITDCRFIRRVRFHFDVAVIKICGGNAELICANGAKGFGKSPLATRLEMPGNRYLSFFSSANLDY